MSQLSSVTFESPKPPPETSLNSQNVLCFLLHVTTVVRSLLKPQRSDRFIILTKSLVLLR